jgi:hypothetical protein
VFNSHWPWTLSRQDLIDAVQKRLAEVGIEVETSGDLETTVDGLLDFLIVYGQTSFRLKPVLGPSTSGPLCLDETARRMAELSRNDVTAFTFNAWHEPLVLSPIDRDVLPLLDGTRGRDELIEAVLEFARATNVVVERDGRTLTDAAEHREFAAAFVDELPQRLAQMKLIRTPEFS